VRSHSLFIFEPSKTKIAVSHEKEDDVQQQNTFCFRHGENHNVSIGVGSCNGRVLYLSPDIELIVKVIKNTPDDFRYDLS
jgi:hypothetical protein